MKNKIMRPDWVIQDLYGLASKQWSKWDDSTVPYRKYYGILDHSLFDGRTMAPLLGFYYGKPRYAA